MLFDIFYNLIFIISIGFIMQSWYCHLLFFINFIEFNIDLIKEIKEYLKMDKENLLNEDKYVKVMFILRMLISYLSDYRIKYYFLYENQYLKDIRNKTFLHSCYFLFFMSVIYLGRILYYGK